MNSSDMRKARDLLSWYGRLQWLDRLAAGQLVFGREAAPQIQIGPEVLNIKLHPEADAEVFDAIRMVIRKRMAKAKADLEELGVTLDDDGDKPMSFEDLSDSNRYNNAINAAFDAAMRKVAYQGTVGE